MNWLSTHVVIFFFQSRAGAYDGFDVAISSSVSDQYRSIIPRFLSPSFFCFVVLTAPSRQRIPGYDGQFKYYLYVE
jgi:hypothetical protein